MSVYGVVSKYFLWTNVFFRKIPTDRPLRIFRFDLIENQRRIGCQNRPRNPLALLAPLAPLQWRIQGGGFRGFHGTP